MKQDERDGKDREPDMGLQPGLDGSHRHRLFVAPPAQQRREKKDQERQGPVNQAQRSGPDISAQGRNRPEPGGQREGQMPFPQHIRVVVGKINQGRPGAGHDGAEPPAKMRAVDDHFPASREIS